jgi:hypothetical protein
VGKKDFLSHQPISPLISHNPRVAHFVSSMFGDVFPNRHFSDNKKLNRYSVLSIVSLNVNLKKRISRNCKMNHTIFKSLVIPDTTKVGLYDAQIVEWDDERDLWMATGLDLGEYLRSRLAVACSQVQSRILKVNEADTIDPIVLDQLRILAGDVQAELLSAGFQQVPPDTIVSPCGLHRRETLGEVTPSVQCGLGNCECYSQTI